MLTAEQLQFFHDNGFLILRNWLPPRDLDGLRRRADRLQRQAVEKLADPHYLEQAKFLNRDWIEHHEDHFVYRQKDDGKFSFHRIERLYPRDPFFQEMAMSARLLTPVWQILGRPFWPRAGNLVYKLPYEGAAVRWHQDIPYLYWSSGGHPSKGRPTTHPIPNFTTDVYLDRSDESNGCLYAIPGSHRNGTVDVDKIIAAEGPIPRAAVPLELEAGDVMFHHVAVVHGSPENRAPSLRRTFYIHYLADETVQDAYSDWPDLLSSEENQARWSVALESRQKNAADLDKDGKVFTVTPQGLTPRDAR